MTRSAAEESLLAGCEAQLAAHDGRDPAWLLERRREALARFAETGLPTTRQEDWRFTSLAGLAGTRFEPTAAGQAAPAPGVDPAWLWEATEPAHLLVFVDGRFAPDLSRAASIDRGGLRIDALSQVLANEPDRVAAHLGRSADIKARAFVALNTASAWDGLFLELGPGATPEGPIVVSFLRSAEATPRAVQLRNLIIAGPGSRACVIEHYAGPAANAGLTNSVSELLLRADAQIEHIKLQDEGTSGFHIGAILAQQGPRSRLTSHSLALGARLSRTEIEVQLAEEGAEVTLYGLYLGRGEQLVDHHTMIDHAAPETRSTELYKGVLDGKARGVFHGRIHVRPHAQRIDAAQINRNLLLSDDASIHTKPQLEIHADDVRCSHGAAIGRLDADALFYLRTRGIGETDARSLLTFAFASDVTGKLPNPGLAKQMRERVLRWLET